MSVLTRIGMVVLLVSTLTLISHYKDAILPTKGAAALAAVLIMDFLFLLPRMFNLQYLISVQRKLEGSIGVFLLRVGTNRRIKKAGLVHRTKLVKGVSRHYYERPGDKNGPTLLLCHGMASESKNLVALVLELQTKLPSHWRMIAPDVTGHGHDLERVHEMGVDQFPYPEPEDLGEGVKELLDALDIQECFAYGSSMGGCLVYFLQQRYPALVKKSVLIAPALEVVLDDQFLNDWKTGRKNHFCWESREDVQNFMWDLSCPQRIKRNPIPLFLCQAIWQDRQARSPPGHFRTCFQKLLDFRGQDPILACPSDIAPNAKRLVMWPENDFICNYERGKAFFSKSSNNTIFRSIPDCGHLFHSDGKTVLIHAAPMMVEYLLEEDDE